MKAIVYTKYGPPDVLQLREVEKPSPREGEVRIKVQATAVTTGDVNARGFTFVPPGLGPMARLMLGLRGPKKTILGSEVAGAIEAIGKGVRQFKEGDRVFGINGVALGAYAEYVCWPEGAALVEMPANMGYEDAAAVPFGATTALYFLRDKGKIQRGHRVLINGASGSVGTAAVQLARSFGADVTGVCSTTNVEMVRSLGANQVVDYTQEDFTQNGQTYDLILDLVVGHTSFTRCRDSLTDDGLYLAVAGGLKELIQMQMTSAGGGKKVVFGGGESSERKENVLFIKQLIEAGEFRAVIDRRYPLEQIVEAHRYVEEGHKKGNVVITVAHNGKA